MDSPNRLAWRWRVRQKEATGSGSRSTCDSRWAKKRRSLLAVTKATQRRECPEFPPVNVMRGFLQSLESWRCLWQCDLDQVYPKAEEDLACSGIVSESKGMFCTRNWVAM
jgi:hypothetical protein